MQVFVQTLSRLAETIKSKRFRTKRPALSLTEEQLMHPLEECLIRVFRMLGKKAVVSATRKVMFDSGLLHRVLLYMSELEKTSPQA